MRKPCVYSLSLSLSVALALGSLLVLGAPLPAQAALYLPGETLDPACAPTDAGCGISTVVASSTANSIPYYAANGSVLSATSTFQILASGTASTTALIVRNSLTLGSLTGFLKATAGAVATSLINLASDVTGILAVGNGGTGWANIQTGAIPYGAGAGALATTTQGAGGQVLAWSGGIPTWVATSSLNLTVSSFLSPNISQWTNNAGYLTSLAGAASSTLLSDANTFSGANTFTNAPKLATFSGLVGANSGATYQVSTSTLNIGGTAGNVTGTVAVGNGGTGVAAIKSGFIPFGAGASAVATSSSLYWDSANSRLGIGTTSPLSLLAVAGGASIGADYNTAAPANGLIIEGSVGIGTTTPWRAFSLTGTVSSPQFALAYDAARYSQLQVDASGDLSLTSTGGNTRLPDNNLFVCAGGACPTVSISGTGNLTVENKITTGSLEQFCPTGYVWVPGLAQFGTIPGFCTMKYEAKNSGGTAVSDPAGGPWVSIDQPTARAACEALGTGYHLTNEMEWITIATQLATLPINDIDVAASLQLATGHSDNAPASALTAGTSATDPVVSGCNLATSTADTTNAYVASSCEIRGTGSGGSTDADKGYYGTGQQWSASGYGAGGANKSQLRTAVLPNGAVLWDIAGNVLEWTDAYVNGTAEKPTPVADAWAEYTAVTSYVTLNYARPKNPSWASANGIGQYYAGASVGQRAFLRGGGRDSGSGAGVFALILPYAPSFTDAIIGFRCSR